MVLVACLTTSVVVIFYVCLLPHVFDQSLSKTMFHLIFGHWLLANIVFNYVMAAFTDPGHPPRVSYSNMLPTSPYLIIQYQPDTTYQKTG